MSDDAKKDKTTDHAWPQPAEPIKPAFAWLIVDGKVVETKVFDRDDGGNDDGT